MNNFLPRFGFSTRYMVSFVIATFLFTFLILCRYIFYYFISQEALSFAQEHGIQFVTTSAKTGYNVERLFHSIGKISVHLYLE